MNPSTPLNIVRMMLDVKMTYDKARPGAHKVEPVKPSKIKPRKVYRWMVCQPQCSGGHQP